MCGNRPTAACGWRGGRKGTGGGVRQVVGRYLPGTSTVVQAVRTKSVQTKMPGNSHQYAAARQRVSSQTLLHVLTCSRYVIVVCYSWPQNRYAEGQAGISGKIQQWQMRRRVAYAINTATVRVPSQSRQSGR